MKIGLNQIRHFKAHSILGNNAHLNYRLYAVTLPLLFAYTDMLTSLETEQDTMVLPHLSRLCFVCRETIVKQ